jgi:hypothetical protein
MSDPSTTVECGTHGSRTGTFVCQHLPRGSQRGFHCSVPDDDDLWPDAWCNACEEVREKAGGWDEASEGAVEIKLVCVCCYETARENNWIQDDEVFEALCHESIHALQAKQDDLERRFGISAFERWDWDQDRGELVFSHAGVAKVIATVHFTGSFSTHSDTWMWAWANSSNVEQIKSQSRAVRDYGSENSFMRLASAHWTATHSDGWEMTAVMARLLGSVGAYRTPNEGGFNFMVISEVRWAD